MTQFFNAYNKLKENSANVLRNNLKLRRLVIITNLGKNLEENNYNYNKTNLFRSNQFTDIKNNEIFGNNNDIDTKENFEKKNSLLPMVNNNIVNDEEIDKNRKFARIIGLENDSFLSNITRDYLKYNDAIFYDNRDYCSMLAHFLRLKADFINIFYCDYSFAPYTIRLIKFLFFFHFMFYLETLCIGQKYYFKKHFSEEFLNYTEIIYNITNNITNDYNITYENTTNSNLTFLEKHISRETRESLKIHYLYTFKYSFPRILIPTAISLISYFFTAILTPRRKILKAYLNLDLNEKEKNIKYMKIAKKFKIVFIIYGFLALLIMVFFFYSITNYFVIFDDAKYDIPPYFILSGLIRFILDIIIWAIISNIRKLAQIK